MSSAHGLRVGLTQGRGPVSGDLLVPVLKGALFLGWLELGFPASSAEILFVALRKLAF